MSSNAFWTEIRPDPVLRKQVLLAGALLALVGVPVILSLPLSIKVLSLLLVGWLAWSARELLLVWRAYRRCTGYRLSSDGQLLILGHPQPRTATLLPGSVVLTGYAWLRVRDERGLCWGELVAGRQRESEDWRRFQVITRSFLGIGSRANMQPPHGRHKKQ